MKQSKIDEFILETYNRMYKASTPTANFNELLAQADLDGEGKKIIPYMDHSILQEDYDKIITDVIKEYKIPKILRQAFKSTIALGVSPKISK